MPFKDKAMFAAYMRVYRTKRKPCVNPATSERVNPSVNPRKPSDGDGLRNPRKPADEPKAIITKTHHFAIRASRSRPGNPYLIEGVKALARGGGKRIHYGLIDFENAFIEFTRNKVCVVSKRELVDLDKPLELALRGILATVCARKGVGLEGEAGWKVGEWSHTSFEFEPLKAVLGPLAAVEAGNDRLRLFKDSSHDGPEMTGIDVRRATENLHYILLEFPHDFAEYAKTSSELQTRLAKALEALAGQGPQVEAGKVKPVEAEFYA